MEVIRGPQHAAFRMDDATCVGQARRHAATLAAQAGLDEVAAGRLALVVTELGNNLVRHASEGTLLLAVHEDRPEVEVIAMDRGPGMPDVDRSLSDGFSTAGTPGTGLGAVRRLSSGFHLHSTVPEGTVIVSRIRPAGAAPPVPANAIHAAGLRVALAGEIVCGDAWAAAFDGTKAAVIVADGLGHGPDASQASQAAVAVFCEKPFAQPRSLIADAHARLRSTRGAAVTVLHLDSEAGVISCSGAGNVIARLVSGDTDRTLLTQHGTAGVQIRTPEEARVAWPEYAILVVQSDGLESRWNAQKLMPLLARDPVLAAAILLRDHSRGRDDATVVVARRGD